MTIQVAGLDSDAEPMFIFTQSELAAFYHRVWMEAILIMGESPSDSNH